MVVNGTSYAGIGWRPRSLTSSCKNFPIIGPSESSPPKSNAPHSEPEPKGEPKSEPEPNSEPEPKSEPEPTAEPEPEPEPSSEPEPASEPEPTTVAEPTTTARPKSKFRKSAYSRRSAGATTARPAKDDVVETSVSYQVSKHQGNFLCGFCVFFVAKMDVLQGGINVTRK